MRVRAVDRVLAERSGVESRAAGPPATAMVPPATKTRARPRPTAVARAPVAKGAVLIAADEADVRDSLAAVLGAEGYEVTAVTDGAAAVAALNVQEFDVVISEVRMPGADGLTVLRRAREIAPQTLVMLMTTHATVEAALEGLRRGAQDYLAKPLRFAEVLHKLAHLLRHRQVAWENQLLRDQAERGWDLDSLVGRSAAMRDVMHVVRQVAPTRSTVLIRGESGVGKEVVARAIHHFSDLNDRIFLRVNCSGLSPRALESQLFGHLRGAVSGAVSNQEGVFQQARGGTVFLDEIADLPPVLQVKLLHAIEEKEVLPVGATVPIKVEVRVIAATTRDLAALVEEGRFRDDLFSRLSVVDIVIPPLRERREDIPPLVEHFVRYHNRDLKKAFRGIDATTLRSLVALPWKGNVRELANVIERMVMVGEHDDELGDLPRMLPKRTPPPSATDDLRDTLRAYEKAHIQRVLAKVAQDKRVAAEILGVSLSSLYRKIEALEIGLRGTRRLELQTAS